MIKNGHNGEGVPGSLAAFMLSHLKMPEVHDFPRLPIPPEFHRNVPPELSAKTAEGKTLEAMLDNGLSLDDAAKAIKALGENSTGIPPEFHRTIVKDPVAEKRRAYDRERKRRKKSAAKNGAGIPPEHKNGVYISSLTSLLKEEDTKKESKSSGIRASEWFEKFWLVYPKRLGGNPRKPAQDQFTIALKNGHDPEVIIRGAEGYAAECKKSNIVGTAYVAHARTWLRQQRWNDYQQPTLAAADFNSEEYQAARRRALDAIKGT